MFALYFLDTYFALYVAELKIMPCECFSSYSVLGMTLTAYSCNAYILKNVSEVNTYTWLQKM